MKRTLFFLLTLIALPAAAQNSGLFGKTSFVEVTGVGNFSLMNRWLNNDYYYKRNGQNLMKAKDLVNGGVYVAVGTAVKRNVALTLEAGWWMFNTDGPEHVWFGDHSGYTSNFDIRHEKLDARTFSIMPIVEIGGKEGLLPIGISHQIGVGYTRSRILEKDYLYDPVSQGVYSYYDDTGYHTVDMVDFIDSLHTQQDGFVDYTNKYAGVTFLYGLKVRTPITENIMINYGLRYTLNFGSKSGSTEYGIYGREQWTQDEIRRARFYSFISVNFGVSYAF